MATNQVDSAHTSLFLRAGHGTEAVAGPWEMPSRVSLPASSAGRFPRACRNQARNVDPRPWEDCSSSPAGVVALIDSYALSTLTDASATMSAMLAGLITTAGPQGIRSRAALYFSWIQISTGSAGANIRKKGVSTMAYEASDAGDLVYVMSDLHRGVKRLVEIDGGITEDELVLMERLMVAKELAIRTNNDVLNVQAVARGKWNTNWFARRNRDMERDIAQMKDDHKRWIASLKPGNRLYVPLSYRTTACECQSQTA